MAAEGRPHGRAISDEFWNPRTGVTPLAAGAMVTTISGTLATSFGVHGGLSGLVLSLVIGFLFAFDRRIRHPLQRVLFCIVNALTIFTVAAGLNSAGEAAMATSEEQTFALKRAPAPGDEPEEAETRPFFSPWFTP